ncbi:histidine phosphatase family protein [Streptomyces sp. NPDC088124]|uniref:histidine phosphatase family protein n=1 Tax=Streptomyces sp. NPDC088124 TaxID=3154654 RepID=UPI0034269772
MTIRATIRVQLISPAIGPALRAARFGDLPEDGPGVAPRAVDAAGVRQAEAVREEFPRGAAVYVSSSPRCRTTAGLLGLDARPVPELAPWDMGRWQGRTLDEVAAAEPARVSAWLADPSAAPHGGETLLALYARVGRWFETLNPETPRVIAVAEPEIVRAAALHALSAPASAFWRFDVRPLTVTEFTGRDGRWNLHGGRPLAGADEAAGEGSDEDGAN